MILLTGVTGTIGREVLRVLPAGMPVRLLIRDRARLGAPPPGAEVAVADYADGPALLGALRGVRTAFLVTTRIDGADDEAFLRAAREADVRRVVKLSAAAVEDRGATDAITAWQRRSEEALRRSGLAWTFLRPRAFMSNSLTWAASIRAEGLVRALAGDAANAVVDPRDVAAVAATVLLEDGHAAGTHVLTGPEAVTAREQTGVLAALLGRPLDFRELTPDEAAAGLRRRYPEPVVQALLQSAERQRAGAKVRVTDTVERLTGRPASDYAAWAREHRQAFAGLE